MIRVELASSLPIEECITRLRESTGFTMFQLRPLVGRVSRRWICVRKNSSRGNAFEPLLIGKFSTIEDGTIFLGGVRTNLVGPAIQIFILCGWSIITTAFSVAAVWQLPHAGPSLILVPVILLGMFALMLWRLEHDLQVARENRRFLLSFLESIMQPSSAPMWTRGGAWSGTRDWFERR